MAEPEPERKHGFIDTLRSVSAAFFGVQSAKNRAHDESHGKPLHFVIVGLLMTGVFALVVWIAVKLVMRNAGL